MCLCTPEVRTPYCGKEGCTWPQSKSSANVNKFKDPSIHSGFFDLKLAEYCNHPEHDTPGLLCVPVGQGYRHVCPGCGYTRIIHNDSVRL